MQDFKMTEGVREEGGRGEREVVTVQSVQCRVCGCPTNFSCRN